MIIRSGLVWMLIKRKVDGVRDNIGKESED